MPPSFSSFSIWNVYGLKSNYSLKSVFMDAKCYLMEAISVESASIYSSIVHLPGWIKLEEGSPVFEMGSVAGGGFICLWNPISAAKHLDDKHYVCGLGFEIKAGPTPLITQVTWWVSHFNTQCMLEGVLTIPKANVGTQRMEESLYWESRRERDP